MRRRRWGSAAGRGWGAVLLLVALACRVPSSELAPQRALSGGESKADPDAARVDAAPAAPARAVRVHVALGAGDAQPIALELELEGESAELAELTLASAAHGALVGLELSDARGALPFSASEVEEAWVVRAERPVQGALRARYRLGSAVAGFEDAVATTLAPDRFRLAGETALLLPTAFEQQRLSVEVDVDLAALPPGSALASTLGRDTSALECTGAALRHAAFLAGKLNTARFVTEEATDEWVWLEVLGFDARPVSGETAALRSELARYFERRPPSPFIVLMEASVRQSGSFSVVPRSGGVLLELPVGSSWAGPLRIAVARELFRPWFGGEVRMVGARLEPGPPELWFNEGVARALARELLFRFGMLTADEYADEINGIIGSALLSPFASRSSAAVAAVAATDVRARRHLAARGVLLATALGAEWRASGSGSRALDTLLAALFQLARAEGRALTQADWFAAAAEHFGAGAERAFRSIVEAGAPPTVAAKGLGPCFRLLTRRYAEFSLGFDVEQSRARTEDRSGGRASGIVALEPAGPAARAGLRSTDRLVSAFYLDNDPSRRAALEVERAGRTIRIEYSPVGRRVSGPAWVRRADVPDFACAN